jgi:hypothetical protein
MKPPLAHMVRCAKVPYSIMYRLHISSPCVEPAEVAVALSELSNSQVASSRSPGKMVCGWTG